MATLAVPSQESPVLPTEPHYRQKRCTKALLGPALGLALGVALCPLFDVVVVSLFNELDSHGWGVGAEGVGGDIGESSIDFRPVPPVPVHSEERSVQHWADH
jgi:hypothetical protein